MNDTVKNQAIKTLYPLVSAGRISLNALTVILGFNSSESLRSKAQRLGATGHKKKGQALFKKLSRLGKTSEEYIHEVWNEAMNTVKCSESPNTSNTAVTKSSKKYTLWLDNGNVYVTTQLPTREIMLALDDHREILQDYCYSGGTGLTQSQMAAKYGFTKKEFIAYKNIHGWTKTSDGFLDIDVLETEASELAVTLLDRRAKFEKTFLNQKQLRDTEEALSWRKLQAGVWSPFMVAAKSMEGGIKVSSKLKFNKPKTAPIRKLIINANDWQIGEVSQSEELARGGEWSTSLAQDAVTFYMQKIADYVALSGYNYDEVLVCSVGDLGHGLQGYTAHGTKLEVDSVRQEQVRAILTGIQTLIEGARQFTPKVSVYHVEGNHLGFTSTLIFDQIAYWYGGANPVKDVEVHTNYKPLQYIPLGDDTLIVLYHGKTGGPSKGMSPHGPKRERDAYHLIMEGIRKYPNHRNVNLITGHLHHRILEEYSDVTVHTLGTMVAGDFYADQNLFCGTHPTQTIMDLDPQTGLITSIPISLRQV